MRILLDTHIYLWWLQDNPKLSLPTRHIIRTADEVYVSSASLWEACIKISLGKLDANLSDLEAQITQSGFIELPVSAKHVLQLAHLPALHRDPFDRMLLAQAIYEPLHLLTSDAQLANYSDLVNLV